MRNLAEVAQRDYIYSKAFFIPADEPATDVMVSYGNYCYFLCDAIDALCGVEALFALRAAPHKNTAPPFV